MLHIKIMLASISVSVQISHFGKVVYDFFIEVFLPQDGSVLGFGRRHLLSLDIALHSLATHSARGWVTSVIAIDLALTNIQGVRKVTIQSYKLLYSFIVLYVIVFVTT